jgi:hypothetical protein
MHLLRQLFSNSFQEAQTNFCTLCRNGPGFPSQTILSFFSIGSRSKNASGTLNFTIKFEGLCASTWGDSDERARFIVLDWDWACRLNILYSQYAARSKLVMRSDVEQTISMVCDPVVNQCAMQRRVYALQDVVVRR